MLAWDGFGLRAHRTKRTPLLRMVTEGRRARFDRIRVAEDIAGGTAPDFQSDGIPPPRRGGPDRPRDAMPAISCRPGRRRSSGWTPTAQRTGSSRSRSRWPPATSRRRTWWTALGTGLYVGNLWYLNFSDRAGMPHDGDDPVRHVLGRGTARSSPRSTCCGSTTPPTGCSATASSGSPTRLRRCSTRRRTGVAPPRASGSPEPSSRRWCSPSRPSCPGVEVAGPPSRGAW